MSESLQQSHDFRPFAGVSSWRRRRALVQRSFGVVAPLLALAVFSAGLFLIISGSVAVGCVMLLLTIPSTWLGGLWVVPNSVDSYAQKITPLLRNDFAEATLESRQQVERIRAITADIARLGPPPEFIGLHDRLLGVLEEIDSLTRDSPELLADRTAQIMGLRQQLLQIRKELDAYASEPYLVEVAGALDTRMAIASKTVEAVQRPLQRQNEALERLRVPRSWLALHNAYAAQLNSYLAALKTYYGAAEGDSVAAAEIAARALGEQQRKVDKLVEEYRAALWAYYSGSA